MIDLHVHSTVSDGTCTPEELAEKKATLLAAARHGAVMVSPCISPGEKEIAKAAFDEGLPLITLLENGFPPLYKPSGKRFDACAAGRLLLVAPWPYHNEQRPITREQCLALNQLAAAMAGGLAPTSELALGAQDRELAPTSELALGAQDRGVP